MVEVSPPVPSGGAAGATARVGSPWHEEQLSVPEMSSLPSTCVSRFTVVCVYPAWHEAQLVLAGCGAGGGAPWQVPHAACVPFTTVQLGSTLLPPACSVAPWQYVVQVVLALIQAAEVPLNDPKMTSGVPSMCVRSVGFR